jgi:hypothetical protein
MDDIIPNSWSLDDGQILFTRQGPSGRHLELLPVAGGEPTRFSTSKGSDGPRFLLKAPQPLAVSGERLGQNFHRDIAPQPGVAGAIHFAHAARTQRRLDFVRAEFRA